MKTSPVSRLAVAHRWQSQRGSVLISALAFAIIIAISLTSYLTLSTNSLKLSHRTFFANAAANLAETGLEEAVWCFNTMGNATPATNASAVTNAWSGWTLGNTVGDIYMSSMGNGYTSVPTVTISGGGGSGATGTAAIATIEDDAGNTLRVVSKVTITNAGTGYTSAPTVTLTGGGGSGASAVARLSATRTLAFSNLDQNATGSVKVWVAGYDGTSVVPIVVAKSIITPPDGAPIEKTVKIILSKNGALPKGVVAIYGVDWNGKPFADSFLSSTTPGVPPFSAYNPATARAATTVAAVKGPTLDLGQGTVSGNVMTGPGVTLTGGKTITGETVGNFTYNFTMPSKPTFNGATGQYNLGASALPTELPETGDAPAADGKYYYFVNNQTIGSVTIKAGADVVIRGDNTNMGNGLRIGISGSSVGKATIYMDGPVNLSGNDKINPDTWAGALEIYTTTTLPCTFSGNAKFYGCLTAPDAALVGNGGGNDVADLCGSFVVGSVTSNGHMSFHYDEALKDLTTGKAWGLALWKELYTESDRAIYESKLNSF